MQKMKHLVIKIFIALLALSLFSIGGNVYAESSNYVKDMFPAEEVEKEAKAVNEPTEEEQENAPLKEENQNQIGVTVWDFLKMIVATVFVVALLYFMLKFVNKKSRVYKSSQLVENLGGASLGQNRSVQMVKVGERLFVVGVGENIQLLKEIDDKAEREQILNEYNHQLDQLVQPADIISNLMNQVKSKKTNSIEKQPFQQLFNSKLEEMKTARKKTLEELDKKGQDKQ
ncbi:flagellar protein FliO/FliZ [Cytobacillus horneckiae]|uniref:Flagellar biosynthesis protein FliZ n=2 Tax=Cytobacillus horneckiae TaxID=549687 RepID=A0A2N0ZM12_9BACI|nr:flagellar biosynthetic protein FliO [Cytobacillus horneckiae]PKG30543.1 flagellar biosynthesis protein FliZ [Cytobacillus horneckiae]